MRNYGCGDPLKIPSMCDSCPHHQLTRKFCDNKDCYEDGKPHELFHIGAYWDEFCKERDKGMAKRSMKKKKRSHHEHRKVKP